MTSDELAGLVCKVLLKMRFRYGSHVERFEIEGARILLMQGEHYVNGYMSLLQLEAIAREVMGECEKRNTNGYSSRNWRR